MRSNDPRGPKLELRIDTSRRLTADVLMVIAAGSYGGMGVRASGICRG